VPAEKAGSSNTGTCKTAFFRKGTLHIVTM